MTYTSFQDSTDNLPYINTNMTQYDEGVITPQQQSPVDAAPLPDTHANLDQQVPTNATPHPDTHPDLYQQSTTTYTYDEEEQHAKGKGIQPVSDGPNDLQGAPAMTPRSRYGNDDDDEIIDPNSPSPRSQMAQSMLSNSSTTKLLRSIEIIWNVIEIATISTILPIYWDQECDRNGLRTFLIARACIDFVLILLHIWYFSRKRAGLNKFLRFVMSLAEYCFVLYALIQLGDQTTCSQTNPSTFGLSIALCVFTLLILFAPVLLLVLICCCLPCILRAVVRYIELAGAPEHASQEELDKLPQYTYTPTLFTENSIKGSQTECAICMCDYEEGDTLRLLPCQHAFHTTCGDQWALLNKTCAVCRRDIFTGLAPSSTDPAQPVDRTELELA